MFNNISWQGYWNAIALISIAYYFIIYLLYYRKDFGINFLKTRNSSHLSSLPSTSTLSDEEKHSANFQPTALNDSSVDSKMQADESVVAIAQVCIDELNAFFEESKRKRPIKEELMYSLQNILKKYPVIKDSTFQESITNLIIVNCETFCSISLNDDDVVHVWLG